MSSAGRRSPASGGTASAAHITTGRRLTRRYPCATVDAGNDSDSVMARSRNTYRTDGPRHHAREWRAALTVSCWICHHRAVLNVDHLPDHVTVPSFGPRMVCTRCGIIGADARLNWQEQPPRETLTGAQWRT